MPAGRSDVAFVFSNPRHHLEMMAPVAEELARRNIACSLISLAELRGFETPKQSGARRVIPLHVRRRTSSPQGSERGGDEAPWQRRRLAQKLVWRFGLAPRLRWMLGGTRVVVVPNDAVFPYIELVDQSRRIRARTVLMQEGIRFQQPESYTGPRYGSAVSAAVCAWGEGSKDFFLAGRVPESRIVVTGAPRLDNLDIARWRAEGEALARTLAGTLAPGADDAGAPVRPIAFLSNPIEIQGYGSKDQKLELFARLLAGAAPVLRARGIPVIVKNHLHEDPDDYARIAAASPVADLVRVLPAVPIFAAIAAARAAIVLTSTVGLEALTFGLPLGVLEIPGHDFAFEYVQRGAAVPIRIADVAGSLEQLLAPDDTRTAAGRAFVQRHLHDQGRARYNVADVIERVLAGALRDPEAHRDA
jgi:hypothetical protein